MAKHRIHHFDLRMTADHGKLERSLGQIAAPKEELYD